MKKENQLCIISLICMFVIPLVSTLLFRGNGDISGATASAYDLNTKISLISYIIAWILAIAARKKYNTKFSRVLIIIYSVLFAVLIIAIIGVILFLLGMI